MSLSGGGVLLPETVKTATSIVTTLNAEEKLAALEQVLQSNIFARADQLRDFLRYICEMEIAGRAGELCELAIGTNAFRRPDYSTLEDGIVRRRAVHLRGKLQKVYETELADAAIRIALPKGKYVPRFARVELPAQRSHPRASWSVVGLTAWALMASVVALVLLSLRSSRVTASPSVTAAAPAAVTPSSVIERGVSYKATSKQNVLHGGVKVQLCPQCSDGSRVRYIGHYLQNYVVFKDIVVSKDGDYEMVVFYVLRYSRSFFVRVNDGPERELRLTGQSWAEPAKVSVTIPLKAGKNKIKFYNPNDWAPDLDRIIIR